MTRSRTEPLVAPAIVVLCTAVAVLVWWPLLQYAWRWWLS